jgi:hypothetical protein
MKKKERPKYMNWDDCIHIAACRRYSVIVERKTGKQVARNCGRENCSAFCSRSEMVEQLEGIMSDIEEHKDSLRHEISVQLYGRADYNEMISCAISRISGDALQDFIDEYLNDEEQ